MSGSKTAVSRQPWAPKEETGMYRMDSRSPSSTRSALPAPSFFHALINGDRVALPHQFPAQTDLLSIVKSSSSKPIDHGADDSKLHANSYHFLFLSFHTASSSFGEMQDSSTESFWLRPEFSSLKNRLAPRRRMPLSRA